MNTFFSSVLVCVPLVSIVTSMPTNDLLQNTNKNTQLLKIHELNPSKVSEFIDEKLKLKVNLLGSRKNQIQPALRKTEFEIQLQEKLNQPQKLFYPPVNTEDFLGTLEHLNLTEENPHTRKRINRIKNNYEKLQTILQNKTTPSKNLNKIIDVQSKVKSKRSDFGTIPETDVEYQKYGGYISTKVYLPLSATETNTNSNIDDTNETRFVNVVDQVIPTEAFVSKTGSNNFVDMNYIHEEKQINNDSSVSVGSKSQLAEPDVKETFIKLLDEVVNIEKNKQQNPDKLYYFPTKTKINSTSVENEPINYGYPIGQNNYTELCTENKQLCKNKASLLENTSNVSSEIQHLSPIDQKSKFSVMQYQTRYLAGDFRVEKKTSVLSVKQPVEQIDVQTLKSNNKLEKLNSDSNFATGNQSHLLIQENRDLHVSNKDNVTPAVTETIIQSPLLQNVNQENFNENRKNKYQIVENKVSELAKKLMESLE